MISLGEREHIFIHLGVEAPAHLGLQTSDAGIKLVNNDVPVDGFLVVV
jgi:hypothetical protein